jgi:large subunit ribosomal protein L4
MLKKIEQLPTWLAESAEANLGTLWQVVKAYRANRRQGTVGVKTRAMVRSTGKKPYDQKKTGGARRGSFVSPLHVGGGVAHGPVARDYRQALPEKMAHQALRIALAKRVQAGLVFEGNLAVESGKTKDAATLLKSVTSGVGKTIVCLSEPSENTIRAYRNIRGVVLVSPQQLSAIDVIESRNLVVAPAALKAVQARVAK